MNGLHIESTVPAQGLHTDSEKNTFMNRLKSTTKNKMMRTPCNHRFHAPCLLEWMNIKMECPTCRQSLPPL